MNYEIIRPLGRGGMGEVYLARDPRLDRQVALKTLRSDLATPDFEAHLRREAKLLAQLNHPHIVQIFDITEHQGHLALVMEYVDGYNLHIARREGRGETGDLLRWLSEVAAALACAHEAGIAHRDLKAENVLIGHDGTAKVTDFGIAEDTTGSTEQAQDIAALGALAVQLLGDGPELTPGLRYLLEQLLHKRAGQRPTAAAAAESFRIAWHESTQSETTPPVATPVHRRAWLRPALAGLCLALAAGLAYRLLPSEPSHIAVLDPIFSGVGSLPEKEQLAVQTTVQQALQQAVLDSPDLSLVSAAETAALAGTPAQLVAALGADEVIASTLRCTGRSCAVTIERIGTDGTVIARRGTNLPEAAPLESWRIVQGEWPQLFPGSAPLAGIDQRIDPEAYAEYLELHRAVFGSGEARRNSPETLSRVEALITSADRFLPAYELYTHLALNLYDSGGDASYVHRAQRFLSRAGSWAGDSMLLRHSQFQLALEIEDFDTAREEIEQIAALGGDQSLLDFLEGKLHSFQGDYATAAEHFERALALRPSRTIYYNSALNYYRANQPELAAERLRSLLDLYPRDSGAYNVLGMIALHRGAVSEAIAALTTAVDINGGSNAAVNLGLAHMLAGDYASATREIRGRYEAGDQTPITILNLADAEALSGRRETATALYRDIVDGHNKEDGIRDLRALAQAYAQLGQYERAIATLQEAMGRRRESSEDNFTAALVYTLAGQHIAALVEVEQALSRGYGAIWFTLPWFDGLCDEAAFGDLMAQAGSAGHCRRGPDLVGRE